MMVITNLMSKQQSNTGPPKIQKPKNPKTSHLGVEI
jgi:hypothetical protein